MPPYEDILLIPTEEGTFLRTGWCSPHCGACCEAMIIPVNPLVLRNRARFDDWCKWLALHGMTTRVRGEDDVEIHIPIPCSELTKEKTCKVYGTDKRPNVCGRFPRHPYDIESVADICTYKFTKVEEGETAGDTFSRVIRERGSES